MTYWYRRPLRKVRIRCTGNRLITRTNRRIARAVLVARDDLSRAEKGSNRPLLIRIWNALCTTDRMSSRPLVSRPLRDLRLWVDVHRFSSTHRWRTRRRCLTCRMMRSSRPRIVIFWVTRRVRRTRSARLRNISTLIVTLRIMG